MCAVTQTTKCSSAFLANTLTCVCLSTGCVTRRKTVQVNLDISQFSTVIDEGEIKDLNIDLCTDNYLHNDTLLLQ